ncbi:unnamed protein product [Scytosiphon promiscuus]
MHTRRLVMLYSLCRSFQQCSSSRQARSAAFLFALPAKQSKAATTPAAATAPPAATFATTEITDIRGRRDFCLLPSVIGGVGRGGRGMSSDSALFGGRRGGRGRGSGRGRGGRRSPDYGPPRAGQQRNNVSPGTAVEVIQKQHQRTGELTAGTVSRLLTSSGFHPRGIKVMLAGGIVGRVQNISGEDDGPEPGGRDTGGYSTSTSSGGGGSDADLDDARGILSPRVAAAGTAVGTGRRQMSTIGVGETDDPPTAARAPAAAPARSARPIRKFRAERVQGRSWSIEEGEVVARGVGGEEIPGGTAGGATSLGGRDGRGGRRGRGRR